MKLGDSFRSIRKVLRSNFSSNGTEGRTILDYQDVNGDIAVPVSFLRPRPGQTIDHFAVPSVAGLAGAVEGPGKRDEEAEGAD